MNRSLILTLLFLFPVASAVSQSPATATPAATTVSASAPVLSKDQLKPLSKDARNSFKHCSNAKGKESSDFIAQGCLELGRALDGQVHDKANARLAIAYSCSLGKEEACDEWGKGLAADGDLPGARLAWASQPCATGKRCNLSLFKSYADETPPNLASAEQVGLPLCDQGGDDSVCDKLRAIGGHADFAAIAQHHKDARIEQIKTQIGKNNSDIDVAEGLLALSKSAQNSASGLLATLAATAEVKLYESSISTSQKDNQKLMAELQSLQGSTDGAPTTGGLGSALAGLAMQGVANANDVQVAGGTLTAASFTPPSMVSPQSSADTAGPAASLDSSAGTAYSGPNAQWVSKLLATAGPYSCAPKQLPSHSNNFSCAGKDGLVYSAQVLAWGAECNAETGHPEDAEKAAAQLVETLKQAGEICRSGRSTCTTDRIVPCSSLP